MDYEKILDYAVNSALRFITVDALNNEEFENTTDKLYRVIDDMMKEETLSFESFEDIQKWISKNHFEIEERLESPGYHLYQEEEEEQGEVVSTKKEKRLVDFIYGLFEECCAFDEYDIEDATEEISKFVNRFISPNLSMKTFKKCLNKAAKRAKDEMWLDRGQISNLNKFIRFIKEMIVYL